MSELNITKHVRNTQTQMVLNYMREHGSITAIEAEHELGIMRLASRISDLKEVGFKIDKLMVEVETRYGKTKIARYFFAEGIDAK